MLWSAGDREAQPVLFGPTDDGEAPLELAQNGQGATTVPGVPEPHTSSGTLKRDEPENGFPGLSGSLPPPGTGAAPAPEPRPMDLVTVAGSDGTLSPAASSSSQHTPPLPALEPGTLRQTPSGQLQLPGLLGLRPAAGAAGAGAGAQRRRCAHWWPGT